jgi:chromosomal replication initiation ATPase DnaA
VKPVPQDESSNQILKVHSRDRVEVVSPYYAGTDAEKLYTFEEVFDGGANNQYVFNKTMAVPIMNVLQGYNSTVFIYGMTGSGKTYTMFGSLSGGPSLKGK